MKLYTGTSGYSYAGWKGSFYPEKITGNKMLSYYATQLEAVEINNTFYRMPRSEVMDTWAGQVGEDFRFVIKANRRITHFKRLHDAAEEVDYLLGKIERLGARLGAVLFQLPPNFRKDIDRLGAFLELLPPALPAAFEFRHATWEDDEVRKLLSGKGHALCLADTEERGEPAMVKTGDWGYLRLRRETYGADDLAAWRERIEKTGWRHAFVFFKHEVMGPALARDLVRLEG